MTDKELITKFIEQYKGPIDPKLYREIQARRLTAIIERLPSEPISAKLEGLRRLEVHNIHNCKSLEGEKRNVNSGKDQRITAKRSRLSKAAINKFLIWSKTRYNNYLNYGTKSENVDIIFNALKSGKYKNQARFEIQCASPVGENPHYSSGHRYWKTNNGGEIYQVDCVEKTIRATISQREIRFE